MVVIGAGNGGLVAAIRVLQAGYTCLLLEKHNLPGGFATSFKRGRFEFEASLHELNDFGSPEEPGDVRKLFRDLGVEDKIDWVRIPEAYHLIATDKKYDCEMPFGVEAFIDKMEQYVHGSRRSMTDFFALCNEVRDAWMPKMRSHEISLALDARIRELGGDIWYQSEAETILANDDGSIRGVRLVGGKVIETRHVIANCSPHLVYGKMLEKKAVTEQKVRAANSRTFAGRGFTLFLGLNKSAEELGITSHNYFIYDTADTVKQYDLMRKVSTNHVQATVCLNNAWPECSPKGTCMMYFTTMFMSDDWGNVSEEEYFKKKDEVAEDMIRVFERETGCRIRDAIEEISVASPTTYARYCGHPEGVIYGYETAGWDSLMPRMMMMKEDALLNPGIRFAGGYAMRSSGYSSAYISGDLSGRQTVGDLKKEAQGE